MAGVQTDQGLVSMAGRALLGIHELHDAAVMFTTMYGPTAMKTLLLAALDARRVALGRS